ncbi:MAG TPA: hypothetical protein VFW94_06040 [Candidatus Acidoferrales bacterium]|nr:hypothetical protein [Candidatus Acidoferrales bacterium]
MSIAATDNGCATVNVAVLLVIPEADAVILVFPAAIAVATPALLTVATLVLLDVQVKLTPLTVLPVASFAVAV